MLVSEYIAALWNLLERRGYLWAAESPNLCVEMPYAIHVPAGTVDDHYV
jgi:hypothetical protein